jgi:hypothetical protein
VDSDVGMEVGGEEVKRRGGVMEVVGLTVGQYRNSAIDMRRAQEVQERSQSQGAWARWTQRSSAG